MFHGISNMFGGYLYMGPSNMASIDKVSLSYHILLAKASHKANPEARGSEVDCALLGRTTK